MSRQDILGSRWRAFSITVYCTVQYCTVYLFWRGRSQVLAPPAATSRASTTSAPTFAAEFGRRRVRGARPPAAPRAQRVIVLYPLVHCLTHPLHRQYIVVLRRLHHRLTQLSSAIRWLAQNKPPASQLEGRPLAKLPPSRLPAPKRQAPALSRNRTDTGACEFIPTLLSQVAIRLYL